MNKQPLYYWVAPKDGDVFTLDQTDALVAYLKKSESVLQDSIEIATDEILFTAIEAVLPLENEFDFVVSDYEYGDPADLM